jgi:large subunit ribosomal protein L6
MSRIGRKPIQIPQGVEVKLDDRSMTVKGKLGEMSFEIPAGITCDIAGETINFERENNQPPVRALHGLSRALVQNMVTGVSVGFTRRMEVRGTGYRVNVQGNKLTMDIGFSHPVIFDFPSEVTVKLEGNTTREQTPTTIISLTGINKERVGHWADQVHRVYPPEPYKGKGIRYEGERVIRKAGKTG